MTPKQYSAPSVRQLSAVVDGMAGSVSEGRLRQLRMVVDMFGRMPTRTLIPREPTGTAVDLFDERVVRTFWSLAVSGNLRHWQKNVGKPLPLQTQRIVRAFLEVLARQVLPAVFSYSCRHPSCSAE
ncbi:hypothetical protein ABT001_32735 [Streptomyces sp. NPDC002793]|uniref:hypothetical protein n=1 Tax=Streptomyces sp. NPDC002793 TaxID=3154432 RepID=UPI00331FCF82